MHPHSSARKVRSRRSLTARAGILAWVLGTTSLVAQTEDRLQVAVSLPPQVWLVEQLGGDQVNAWSLLQPGDGPETYQPSDAEVTQAARADLFVLIGVPFERGAWARALRQRPGLRIVEPPEFEDREPREVRGHDAEDRSADSRERDAQDEHGHEEADAHDHHDDDEAQVETDDPHDHREEQGHGAHGHVHDPHIWLSPRRLVPHAEAITDALISLRPSARPAFEERLEATLVVLEDLHREIASVLADGNHAPFLVHHPSWTTFAEDFGVQQLAIESSGHEPSDAELTELLRRARAEGVKVLFIQPGFAGASRHAVAAALNARVQTLDPLPADLPAGLLETARQIALSGGSR